MVFLQSQDYWIFDHFFVSLFHHFDYYGCEKVTNHVCQCWYSGDCNQTWSLRWEIDQRPILLVKDSTLPKTNKWSNKIPQHTQVHVLHHLGDSTLKKMMVLFISNKNRNRKCIWKEISMYRHDVKCYHLILEILYLLAIGMFKSCTINCYILLKKFKINEKQNIRIRIYF